MQNRDVFHVNEKFWIFIFVNLFVLINCNQQNPVDPVPADLTLQVQTVAFNWDTTKHAADALNLRKNFIKTFTLPEYSLKNNAPALYLAEQSEVKIKVTFSLEQPAEITLRIKGLPAAQNRIFSGTNEAVVRFAAGVSDTVVFTLQEPIPPGLQMSDESFHWEILDENYKGQAASGPHRIFVVFREPAAIGSDSCANCWHRDLASPQAPWADALELAMRPEQGNVAGQTTPAAALQNLTSYFFAQHGAEYDVYAESLNHYCKVWEKSFDLSRYLFEMNRSKRVTCYDQGGALRIMGALLGIDVEVVYVARVGYIQTAPLVGIGPCNNPFYRFRGQSDTQLISEPVVDENLISPYRTKFGNHILNRWQGRIYDATTGPNLGQHNLDAYLARFIDISTKAEKAASDYPEKLTVENWSDRFTFFANPPDHSSPHLSEPTAVHFWQCVQQHFGHSSNRH